MQNAKCRVCDAILYRTDFTIVGKTLAVFREIHINLKGRRWNNCQNFFTFYYFNVKIEILIAFILNFYDRVR